MIKNYFVVALRSLLKNKLFSLINIVGLALSMSVGVLVLIRMSDAFDHDSFHPDRDKIYRIISKVSNSQRDSWKLASSPLPLSGSIADNNLQTTFIYPAIHSTVKDGSREFGCNGTFIEPSFFEMFGFQLSSGTATSLNAPQRLLISEEFSKRFFGASDPVGKIVTIDNLGEFEITGVVQTPPSKSHIKYDVFVSMASAKSDELQNWDSFERGYTYVKIDDETEKNILVHDLEQKVKDINRTSTEGKFEFELQPLSSISPSPSDIFNDIGRSPSFGSLMAEMSIVLVILVAACFNYTNLSIARALTRGKEIGVRKLSGATRLQIISQYVIESMVISLLSLVIANVILAPILEYQPFNDGYEMIPELHFSWRFIGFVAAFTLLTGIMAGLLPAWLLSSFRPVRVLRGIATEKLMGRMSLRKTLLVFQFSLSLIVLVFLSTFYQQFNFLTNADPGFNRENILLVPKGTHADVTSAAFNKIGAVRTVGFTSGRFGHGISMTASRERNIETPTSVDYYACDEGWLKMMKLETVAGAIVLNDPQTVVINEKAVTALGFQNSEEATGSLIYIQDSTRVTIKAVVKNFYANGYGNVVKPIIFRGDDNLFKLIAVESNYSNSLFISDIEKEWLSQNPSHAFDYTLLGDEMNSENDQTATVSLLGFLGLITISIASLGLLGLVVYTIEVRRKEISVRKIIGASVQQLVTLLSKGFLSILCIAGAIALPIGYVMGELFLMNFVNHISINLLQLLGCFGLLLVIGLTTILSQTVAAANEDPARNLRSE